MKFRKKPVVIDAFQVGSSNAYPDWLHDAISAKVVITHGAQCAGWGDAFDNADIVTLEGTMHAQHGDWIIKGVAGELCPCKPEIFAATYEAAE